MTNKWEYGKVYEKYNMEGEIKIGKGVLKVHNIFDPMPDFMKKADIIFCDPPCSKGNLNTFYTKAGRTDYQNDYQTFANRLLECIKDINPKIVYLELFKSNVDYMVKRCSEMYTNVTLYETTYYHNKRNKCYVVVCSNTTNTDELPFAGMDEEDVIKWVCANVDYNCIGDLCMGRGLVGWNAHFNKKSFVGTELNKKRLAVLVDKITNDLNT